MGKAKAAGSLTLVSTADLGTVKLRGPSWDVDLLPLPGEALSNTPATFFLIHLTPSFSSGAGMARRLRQQAT